MQAIADILKKVSDDELITKRDLYELKETEVISIIMKSKYKEAFEILINSKKVNISKEEPDVYFINHGAKVRYIDPLYNGKRISKECKIADKTIKKNLSYKMDNYVFIDDRLNVLN